jgi:hypothetical protein
MTRNEIKAAIKTNLPASTVGFTNSELAGILTVRANVRFNPRRIGIIAEEMVASGEIVATYSTNLAWGFSVGRYSAAH